MLREVMDQFIEDGTGILQLPCPEFSYLERVFHVHGKIARR
jgi:predicted secreted protein